VDDVTVRTSITVSFADLLVGDDTGSTSSAVFVSAVSLWAGEPSAPALGIILAEVGLRTDSRDRTARVRD